MSVWKSLTFALVLVLLVGCGSDDDAPSAPSGPRTEIVTGEVTALEDMTPVDGGLTIDIALGDDRADRLYLPSLFTAEPPGEDLLRLYDVARRVEPGDVVRAEGQRNGEGLLISSLWILDGTP